MVNRLQRDRVRGDLFLLPPSFDEFPARPKEVFDSAEELLNAGWRID